MVAPIPRWLQYLKEIRLFAPASIKEYQAAITYFSRETDPFKVQNRGEVRRILLEIKEKRHWSDASAHKNSKCIKNFYAWAQSEGLIDFNPYPFNEFKKPRAKRPEFLTEDIYRQLISNQFLPHRDITLMMVLWDTGIRAEECATLEHDQIDLEKGTIHIPSGKSKGGFSDRYIPIMPKTIQHLKLQINSAKLNAPNSTAVFLTKWWTPISARDVDEILDRAGKLSTPSKSGPVQICAKMFRHGFGIRMLRLGAQQLTVMYWLGHSSLAMTKHYLNATAEDSIALDPRRQLAIA